MCAWSESGSAVPFSFGDLFLSTNLMMVRYVISSFSIFRSRSTKMIRARFPSLFWLPTFSIVGLIPPMTFSTNTITIHEYKSVARALCSVHAIKSYLRLCEAHKHKVSATLTGDTCMVSVSRLLLHLPLIGWTLSCKLSSWCLGLYKNDVIFLRRKEIIIDPKFTNCIYKADPGRTRSTLNWLRKQGKGGCMHLYHRK